MESKATLRTSSSARRVFPEKRRPPKESFCEFDIVENYERRHERRSRSKKGASNADLTKKINEFSERNAKIEELYGNKQLSSSSGDCQLESSQTEGSKRSESSKTERNQEPESTKREGRSGSLKPEANRRSESSKIKERLETLKPEGNKRLQSSKTEGKSHISKPEGNKRSQFFKPEVRSESSKPQENRRSESSKAEGNKRSLSGKSSRASSRENKFNNARRNRRQHVSSEPYDKDRSKINSQERKDIVDSKHTRHESKRKENWKNKPKDNQKQIENSVESDPKICRNCSGRYIKQPADNKKVITVYENVNVNAATDFSESLTSKDFAKFHVNKQRDSNGCKVQKSVKEYEEYLRNVVVTSRNGRSVIVGTKDSCKIDQTNDDKKKRKNSSENYEMNSVISKANDCKVYWQNGNNEAIEKVRGHLQKNKNGLLDLDETGKGVDKLMNDQKKHIGLDKSEDKLKNSLIRLDIIENTGDKMKNNQKELIDNSKKENAKFLEDRENRRNRKDKHKTRNNSKSSGNQVTECLEFDATKKHEEIKPELKEGKKDKETRRNKSKTPKNQREFDPVFNNQAPFETHLKAYEHQKDNEEQIKEYFLKFETQLRKKDFEEQGRKDFKEYIQSLAKSCKMEKSRKDTENKEKYGFFGRRRKRDKERKKQGDASDSNGNNEEKTIEDWAGTNMNCSKELFRSFKTSERNSVDEKSNGLIILEKRSNSKIRKKRNYDITNANACYYERKVEGCFFKTEDRSLRLEGTDEHIEEVENHRRKGKKGNRSRSKNEAEVDRRLSKKEDETDKRSKKHAEDDRTRNKKEVDNYRSKKDIEDNKQMNMERVDDRRFNNKEVEDDRNWRKKEDDQRRNNKEVEDDRNWRRKKVEDDQRRNKNEVENYSNMSKKEIEHDRKGSRNDKKNIEELEVEIKTIGLLDIDKLQEKGATVAFEQKELENLDSRNKQITVFKNNHQVKGERRTIFHSKEKIQDSSSSHLTNCISENPKPPTSATTAESSCSSIKRNIIEVTADESLRKLLELYKKQQEDHQSGIYNRKEFRTTINVLRSPKSIHRKELSISNLNLNLGLCKSLEDASLVKASSKTALALRDICKVAELEKIRIKFLKRKKSCFLVSPKKGISQNNKFHRCKHAVPNERIVEISSKISKDEEVKFTVEGVEPVKKLLQFKQKPDPMELKIQRFLDQARMTNLEDSRKKSHEQKCDPVQRSLNQPGTSNFEDKEKSCEYAEKHELADAEEIVEEKINLKPKYFNLNIQTFAGIDLNLSDIRLLNHGIYRNEKVFSRNSINFDAPSVRTFPLIANVSTVSSPRGKRSFNLLGIKKEMKKKSKKLEVYHNKDCFVKNQGNSLKSSVIDSTTQTSARVEATGGLQQKNAHERDLEDIKKEVGRNDSKSLDGNEDGMSNASSEMIEENKWERGKKYLKRLEGNKNGMSNASSEIVEENTWERGGKKDVGKTSDSKKLEVNEDRLSNASSEMTKENKWKRGILASIINHDVDLKTITENKRNLQHVSCSSDEITLRDRSSSEINEGPSKFLKDNNTTLPDELNTNSFESFLCKGKSFEANRSKSRRSLSSAEIINSYESLLHKATASRSKIKNMRRRSSSSAEIIIHKRNVAIRQDKPLEMLEIRRRREIENGMERFLPKKNEFTHLRERTSGFLLRDECSPEDKSPQRVGQQPDMRKTKDNSPHRIYHQSDVRKSKDIASHTVHHLQIDVGKTKDESPQRVSKISTHGGVSFKRSKSVCTPDAKKESRARKAAKSEDSIQSNKPGEVVRNSKSLIDVKGLKNEKMSESRRRFNQKVAAENRQIDGGRNCKNSGLLGDEKKGKQRQLSSKFDANGVKDDEKEVRQKHHSSPLSSKLEANAGKKKNILDDEKTLQGSRFFSPLSSKLDGKVINEKKVQQRRYLSPLSSNLDVKEKSPFSSKFDTEEKAKKGERKLSLSPCGTRSSKPKRERPRHSSASKRYEMESGNTERFKTSDVRNLNREPRRVEEDKKSVHKREFEDEERKRKIDNSKGFNRNRNEETAASTKKMEENEIFSCHRNEIKALEKCLNDILQKLSKDDDKSCEKLQVNGEKKCAKEDSNQNKKRMNSGKDSKELNIGEEILRMKDLVDRYTNKTNERELISQDKLSAYAGKIYEDASKTSNSFEQESSNQSYQELPRRDLLELTEFKVSKKPQRNSNKAVNKGRSHKFRMIKSYVRNRKPNQGSSSFRLYKNVAQESSSFINKSGLEESVSFINKNVHQESSVLITKKSNRRTTAEKYPLRGSNNGRKKRTRYPKILRAKVCTCRSGRCRICRSSSRVQEFDSNATKSFSSLGDVSSAQKITWYESSGSLLRFREELKMREGVRRRDEKNGRKEGFNMKCRKNGREESLNKRRQDGRNDGLNMNCEWNRRKNDKRFNEVNISTKQENKWKMNIPQILAVEEKVCDSSQVCRNARRNVDGEGRRDYNKNNCHDEERRHQDKRGNQRDNEEGRQRYVIEKQYNKEERRQDYTKGRDSSSEDMEDDSIENVNASKNSSVVEIFRKNCTPKKAVAASDDRRKFVDAKARNTDELLKNSFLNYEEIIYKKKVSPIVDRRVFKAMNEDRILQNKKDSEFSQATAKKEDGIIYNFGAAIKTEIIPKKNEASSARNQIILKKKEVSTELGYTNKKKALIDEMLSRHKEEIGATSVEDSLFEESSDEDASLEETEDQAEKGYAFQKDFKSKPLFTSREELLNKENPRRKSCFNSREDLSTTEEKSRENLKDSFFSISIGENSRQNLKKQLFNSRENLSIEDNPSIEGGSRENLSLSGRIRKKFFPRRKTKEEVKNEPKVDKDYLFKFGGLKMLRKVRSKCEEGFRKSDQEEENRMNTDNENYNIRSFAREEEKNVKIEKENFDFSRSNRDDERNRNCGDVATKKIRKETTESEKKSIYSYTSSSRRAEKLKERFDVDGFVRSSGNENFVNNREMFDFMKNMILQNNLQRCAKRKSKRKLVNSKENVTKNSTDILKKEKNVCVQHKLVKNNVENVAFKAKLRCEDKLLRDNQKHSLLNVKKMLKKGNLSIESLKSVIVPSQMSSKARALSKSSICKHQVGFSLMKNVDGLINNNPFYINREEGGSVDSLEKPMFHANLRPLTAVFNFSPPTYAYHVYNSFTVYQKKVEKSGDVLDEETSGGNRVDDDEALVSISRNVDEDAIENVNTKNEAAVKLIGEENEALDVFEGNFPTSSDTIHEVKTQEIEDEKLTLSADSNNNETHARDLNEASKDQCIGGLSEAFKINIDGFTNIIDSNVIVEGKILKPPAIDVTSVAPTNHTSSNNLKVHNWSFNSKDETLINAVSHDEALIKADGNDPLDKAFNIKSNMQIKANEASESKKVSNETPALKSTTITAANVSRFIENALENELSKTSILIQTPLAVIGFTEAPKQSTLSTRQALNLENDTFNKQHLEIINFGKDPVNNLISTNETLVGQHQKEQMLNRLDKQSCRLFENSRYTDEAYISSSGGEMSSHETHVKSDTLIKKSLVIDEVYTKQVSNDQNDKIINRFGEKNEASEIVVLKQSKVFKGLDLEQSQLSNEKYEMFERAAYENSQASKSSVLEKSQLFEGILLENENNYKQLTNDTPNVYNMNESERLVACNNKTPSSVTSPKIDLHETPGIRFCTASTSTQTLFIVDENRLRNETADITNTRQGVEHKLNIGNSCRSFLETPIDGINSNDTALTKGFKNVFQTPTEEIRPNETPHIRQFGNGNASKAVSEALENLSSETLNEIQRRKRGRDKKVEENVANKTSDEMKTWKSHSVETSEGMKLSETHANETPDGMRTWTHYSNKTSGEMNTWKNLIIEKSKEIKTRENYANETSGEMKIRKNNSIGISEGINTWKDHANEMHDGMKTWKNHLNKTSDEMNTLKDHSNETPGAVKTRKNLTIETSKEMKTWEDHANESRGGLKTWNCLNETSGEMQTRKNNLIETSEGMKTWENNTNETSDVTKMWCNETPSVSINWINNPISLKTNKCAANETPTLSPCLDETLNTNSSIEALNKNMNTRMKGFCISETPEVYMFNDKSPMDVFSGVSNTPETPKTTWFERSGETNQSTSGLNALRPKYTKSPTLLTGKFLKKKHKLTKLSETSDVESQNIKINYMTKTNTPVLKQTRINESLSETPSVLSCASIRDIFASNESGYESSKANSSNSIRNFFKKGGSLLDVFKKSKKIKGRVVEEDEIMGIVNAEKSKSPRDHHQIDIASHVKSSDSSFRLEVLNGGKVVKSSESLFDLAVVEDLKRERVKFKKCKNLMGGRVSGSVEDNFGIHISCLNEGNDFDGSKRSRFSGIKEGNLDDGEGSRSNRIEEGNSFSGIEDNTSGGIKEHLGESEEHNLSRITKLNSSRFKGGSLFEQFINRKDVESTPSKTVMWFNLGTKKKMLQESNCKSACAKTGNQDLICKGTSTCRLVKTCGCSEDERDPTQSCLPWKVEKSVKVEKTARFQMSNIAVDDDHNEDANIEYLRQELYKALRMNKSSMEEELKGQNDEIEILRKKLDCAVMKQKERRERREDVKGLKEELKKALRKNRTSHSTASSKMSMYSDKFRKEKKVDDSIHSDKLHKEKKVDERNIRIHSDKLHKEKKVDERKMNIGTYKLHKEKADERKMGIHTDKLQTEKKVDERKMNIHAEKLHKEKKVDGRKMGIHTDKLQKEKKGDDSTKKRKFCKECTRQVKPQSIEEELPFLEEEVEEDTVNYEEPAPTTKIIIHEDAAELPEYEDESLVSQRSLQSQKLTDKEVFDRLLTNFERKSSIAERLSQNDDFFAKSIKSIPSNTSVEGEEEDGEKPEKNFKLDINKFRGPKFTDKDAATKIDCSVNAEDIGTCFARGFRPDNLMLSGEACFNLNKQDKMKMSPYMFKTTESIIDFSERETPLDFLLALGFMVDEASNALKDDDIRSRLLAAITEARVWINKISTTQGTLLYLVAYKARPETMRYFLQLVEAIINKRISNAIKLDGFLRVLEQVEDGTIQMISILGENKFEDAENEEKAVKRQLKHLFIDVYTIAEEEALKVKKDMNVSQVNMLRVLVSKYRAGLLPHLELIAKYIGQGLLDSHVQLEAAMIFLSRLDTADVKLKEFENYCGIHCEKK